jgi:hypothetical protein
MVTFRSVEKTGLSGMLICKEQLFAKADKIF